MFEPLRRVPVLITVELLERLRHLTADPDLADGLAAALAGLCIDLGGVVPSWVSVSIVLTSANDGDVEVAVVAPARRTGRRCSRPLHFRSPNSIRGTN
jgi:hypothetical protein